MFERKNYKKQAREQLTNHWKSPLLIGAAITFFFGGLWFVFFNQMFKTVTMIEQTGDTSAVYHLVFSLWGIGLVACFIFGIIYMATCHFYFSFAKDNNNSTFSTFLEGFAFWSKGARGYLWLILWIALWTLLFFIPSILASLLVVLFTLGFLFFLMPFIVYTSGIIKGLAYSQMFFVMADNPKTGVRRAMRISIEMTKGHKGELFVMYLSFLGWMALAILPYLIISVVSIGALVVNMFMTISDMSMSMSPLSMDINAINTAFSLPSIFGLVLFYVGYLWVAPYMLTSFTYAYHYMKQDAINRKTLTYADFGEVEPVPAIEGATAEKPTIEEPAGEGLTTEKPAIEE